MRWKEALLPAGGRRAADHQAAIISGNYTHSAFQLDPTSDLTSLIMEEKQNEHQQEANCFSACSQSEFHAYERRAGYGGKAPPSARGMTDHFQGAETDWL